MLGHVWCSVTGYVSAYTHQEALLCVIREQWLSRKLCVIHEQWLGVKDSYLCVFISKSCESSLKSCESSLKATISKLHILMVKTTWTTYLPRRNIVWYASSSNVFHSSNVFQSVSRFYQWISRTRVQLVFNTVSENSNREVQWCRINTLWTRLIYIS